MGTNFQIRFSAVECFFSVDDSNQYSLTQPDVTLVTPTHETTISLYQAKAGCPACITGQNFQIYKTLFHYTSNSWFTVISAFDAVTKRRPPEMIQISRNTSSTY